MDTINLFIQMEIVMKVYGKKIKEKEKDHNFFIVVTITLAIGNKY
jgi:hypothetical protein